MVRKLTCKLCQSPNVRKLFIKNNYWINECQVCNIRFVNLEENYQSFIERFYSAGYFRGSENKTAYADYEGDRTVIAKNFHSLLNKITKIKAKGRLLDIGCATGLFLEEAKKIYSVYGLEPSRYAFNLARKRFRNRIKFGVINSTGYKKNYFDIITLFDVLEHLDNPLSNLNNINEILNDSGYLVIITGDTGSLYSRLLGKLWHYYIPPQHLFFFNRSNMELILKRANFEIVKIETKGKWFSIRYLLHLARTIYKNKLADYLFRLFENSYIGKLSIYLSFGDTMIVYAQKINSKSQ